MVFLTNHFPRQGGLNHVAQGCASLKTNSLEPLAGVGTEELLQMQDVLLATAFAMALVAAKDSMPNSPTWRPEFLPTIGSAEWRPTRCR